jgi:EmrB/QacA subfamily drug resistance transporter
MSTRIATPVRSSQKPVLAIILASYLMIVVDISIVIAALPAIRADLGFSTTDLSWVQNSYTLAFGGLLLLGARAGDTLGRRRMFMLGLALFTAASLAVGLATSPTWLLTARVLQGVGAATLVPSTLALLSTEFPEGPARTRAVAAYASVAGIGASLGLVLGGVLTDLLSWRVGFLINVPIGAVLLIAAPRFLPETERRPAQFDLTGAFTSTLGMSSLVYGIVRSATAGWTEPATLTAVIAGVALLALFVLGEWRAKQPIMPLWLFADRERAGAYAVRVLFLGAMVAFWFFTSQFLQNVGGFSPLLAGIAFLPTTLVNFAVATAVPRLTRRFGNAPLLAGGIAVALIGMVWLSRLDADTPYLTGVALPMILIGMGQGAALGPLTAAGIARVGPRDAGAASGVVNAAHQLGGSLGLGILVAVAAAAGSSSGTPASLAHGISAAFTVGSAMLALAALLVVVLIVPKRHHP